MREREIEGKRQRQRERTPTDMYRVEFTSKK